MTTKEILLVEDSADDAELVTHVLDQVKRADSIFVAKDGEVALDYIFCRGSFAARVFDDAPKLILLDLKLPKIDGMEVLKQIKENPRTRLIPVVILTSSREQRDLVRSYDLGVNSYIQKPVDFDEFRQTISMMALYWMVLNQRPAASVAVECSVPGRP